MAANKKEYRLLGQHVNSDGSVSLAGETVKLSAAQAASLVNKIVDVATVKAAEADKEQEGRIASLDTQVSQLGDELDAVRTANGELTDQLKGVQAEKDNLVSQAAQAAQIAQAAQSTAATAIDALKADNANLNEANEQLRAMPPAPATKAAAKTAAK